ncbi:hypothetical protein [Nostoc sp.]|uniref:hypothetical protein n=1 Tax=Nostoc sp. TaxID=1180 RepID=UPI002FFB05B6
MAEHHQDKCIIITVRITCFAISDAYGGLRLRTSLGVRYSRLPVMLVGLTIWEWQPHLFSELVSGVRGLLWTVYTPKKPIFRQHTRHSQFIPNIYQLLNTSIFVSL